MTATYKDRVRETSTTTGTGTLSLGGAVSGYRTFVAGIGNGVSCFYVIVHRGAAEWEVGEGVITDATPDTLSRVTVHASSSDGALVSFSAGTKDVFNDAPAAYLQAQDDRVTVLEADSVAQGVRLTNLELAAPPPSTAVGTYRISGGTIAWVSGFTFRVGATTYKIDGVTYTSAEQTVALDAADSTNPRTDVLTLDAAGALSKVTGSAAPAPAVPTVDETVYLPLTTVDVPAAASAAGVTETTIWKEDAGPEWNATPSAGTIVVASTNNPRSGTKCIEGTAVAAGQSVAFAIDSGSINLALQDKLILYPRLKAAFPTKKVFQVTWLAGAVAKGATVSIGNGDYGLNTSTIGAYQQVVVPLSAFSVPAGSAITGMRIGIAGSGASVGFYLDDIILQTGASASTPQAQQFRWRGLWSTLANYVANDVVRRGATAYIALLPSTGLAPENYPATWDALVQSFDPINFYFAS